MYIGNCETLKELIEKLRDEDIFKSIVEKLEDILER